MNKFFALVKKEVRELLTPYMLIPLVLTLFIFLGLGKVIGQETEKMKAPQALAIVDQDHSQTSAQIIDKLEKSNFKILQLDQPETEALETAKSEYSKALLIIPAGFEKSVQNGAPEKLTTYSILSNFSIAGTQGAQTLKAALLSLNQPSNPILTNDHTVVVNRQANISLEAVMGFVQSQSYFIPIILFIIIIFAAQMIATSIASEKENKTLETLLSSPVSRQYIVMAKLVSAGLVALLFALVYIFSMRYYMNSLTSGSFSASLSTEAQNAINQLGLAYGPLQYLLLGVSLFLGILSALAIALILGAFAEDVKGVQGVITPLIILVMIPYFLVMFLDINTLSPAIRNLVYLIPFSHPFLAVQYLLLHNYQPVIYGILYLLLVFLVFVYVASRIFSTDHILTLRLGKRKA